LTTLKSGHWTFSKPATEGFNPAQYADGSCWSELIERLQLVGLKVTAVQKPQNLLADDMAATRRILALPDGPRCS
jgi:hypothetical protein